MEVVTVKYLGELHAAADEDVEDIYTGFDPEAGENITLAVGEEAEVSNAKAAQLAEDFPGFFEIDGKTAPKTTVGTAEEPAELEAQLMKSTRAELDAAAEQLGVPEPAQLPNKAAVVSAIVAVKHAADAEAEQSQNQE